LSENRKSDNLIKKKGRSLFEVYAGSAGEKGEYVYKANLSGFSGALLRYFHCLSSSAERSEPPVYAEMEN
jgi:hypothetical protein